MSIGLFAMRLRKIRERRGMTQAVLARKVDVSRGYLSRLEMGRHDPPLSRVLKLAKALGVKPSQLVDSSTQEE
jgi:transcriptional regulator with XRE-family HTH domain